MSRRQTSEERESSMNSPKNLSIDCGIVLPHPLSKTSEKSSQLSVELSDNGMSEERKSSIGSPKNLSIDCGIVISSTPSKTGEKSSSLSVEVTDRGSIVSSNKTFSTSSILDTSSSQDVDTERDEDEPPCKLFRWGEDGYEFVENEDFSVNQALPTLSYSWSPSSVSLSTSEAESSPKFLFRDLPAVLSMRKALEPSSPNSNALVPSPKTPNRGPNANGYKTPARSLMNNVDNLSPVFDKLKLGRKKIKPALSFSSFTTKSSLNASFTSDDHPPLDVLSCYQPVVLLVSESATRDYAFSLAQFATTFRAKIVRGSFEHKVTHVLLDEEDHMKLEHIQAVGFKKYLVKLSWIKNCIREECLLDPATFEDVLVAGSKVPPTCLARSSVRELFGEYAFFCAEPFYSKISYDQLVELLRCNGAHIITDPRDFARCKRKVRVCIVGEPFYYSIEKNKQELRDRLKGCKLVKVHHQWIFEVFATFRLQPLIEHLYDSTLEEASIAGVPRSLLE